MSKHILVPKENPHLLGHGEPWQRLTRLYQQECMPHALMLTGSKGIGKATFGYHMARYILASSSKIKSDALPENTERVPAEHPVFRRVLQGGHSDFFSVEKEEGAATIPVEKIRELTNFLHKTPAESHWRVAVIDSVDELNLNAANALLKILEEPPARALLLLISHAPGKLLPTIRSRCRKLALTPLTYEVFNDLFTLLEIESDEPMQLIFEKNHGIPGLAIDYMNAQGEELNRKLWELMDPEDAPRSLLRIQQFCDKIAPKTAFREWHVAGRLLMQILAALIYQRSDVKLSERYPSLKTKQLDLLHYHANRHPLDYWLKLWEKANSLLADTDRIHLDKHLVMSQLLQQLTQPNAK